MSILLVAFKVALLTLAPDCDVFMLPLEDFKKEVSTSKCKFELVG